MSVTRSAVYANYGTKASTDGVQRVMRRYRPEESLLASGGSDAHTPPQPSFRWRR
jgi:hypothetical protein